MTKADQIVFSVVLVAIFAWTLLGPRGWVSGVAGALVGVAVGLALVAQRRRRDRA